MPFGFDLEENVGLDILFKLRGARPAPYDVVIVSIDKDFLLSISTCRLISKNGLVCFTLTSQKIWRVQEPQ